VECGVKAGGEVLDEGARAEAVVVEQVFGVVEVVEL
jgi:hypothetical protein